jgi:hypothetical protein
LDDEGNARVWGSSGNFWDITRGGSFATYFIDRMRTKNGDSMCVSTLSTAKLLQVAGCSNVHIRCEATDVGYLMGNDMDGMVDLTPVKECLREQCALTLAAQDLRAVAGIRRILDATLLGLLGGAVATFSMLRAHRRTGGQPLLAT